MQIKGIVDGKFYSVEFGRSFTEFTFLAGGNRLSDNQKAEIARKLWFAARPNLIEGDQVQS